MLAVDGLVDEDHPAGRIDGRGDPRLNLLVGADRLADALAAGLEGRPHHIPDEGGPGGELSDGIVDPDNGFTGTGAGGTGTGGADGTGGTQTTGSPGCGSTSAAPANRWRPSTP